MPIVTHRPGPPTLPETEAGLYIGCAAATLRNWRSKHRGPPYIRCGRRIRYLVADLDQWIARHRIDPEAG